MTTYNTGNPLGSTAVKDLYDNAENFDVALNTTDTTWVDRGPVGVPRMRKSWDGLQNDIANAILRTGYEFIGDYDSPGELTFTSGNQVMSKGGEYWRPGPSLALPYTTVNNWVTDQPKFVSTGDASLRQALAPIAGASLVGGVRRQVDSIASLKTTPARYDNDLIRTTGYRSANPGFGAANYRWSAVSTATANDSTVVQVTGVSTGRYLIELDGGPLLASQAGAVADYAGATGTDNRVGLQAFLDAWPHVKFDGIFGMTFDTANTGAGLIVNQDNKIIEFAPNSGLSALPHNDPIYQMFRIWNKNNVTLRGNNAILDGRKDLNGAVTGEFGMGIDIRGGSGHRVSDIKTTNCWGDGFYIGLSAIGGIPSDVIIDRHTATFCRRQGMSIIAANNLTVNDPVWTDIAGTAPAAGLDIEPDSNADQLLGIRINRPFTARCTSGILVDIRALRTDGSVGRDVDIVVTSHIDVGSAVAWNCGGCDTLGNTVAIKGKVHNIEPNYVNTLGSAVTISEWDVNGPEVLVYRPHVQDSNQAFQTSPRYGAPFVVLRDTGSAFTYPIGNVKIVEASVVIQSSSVPLLFFFDDTMNGNTNLSNCHFIDPVKIEGVSDVRGAFFGTGSWSDRYNVWNYVLSGTTVLDNNYNGPISFPVAAANVTIPSGLSIAGSPDLVLKAPGSATYSVILPAAGAVVGLPAVTQLRTVGGGGSYIRLRPIAPDKFLLIERVGIWADI